MDTVYDIAVIGAGPAGISAAVNASLLGRSVLWIGGDIMKTKAARAEKVMNYIGLPGISGAELCRAMTGHAESMGLSPLDGKVDGIYRDGDIFTLLSGSVQFEAKTAILCTGADAAAACEGETEFLGKGISYCATCDGFLYRGKTVGIYVADAKYEGEAKMLASSASKSYLFPLYRDPKICGDCTETIMKKPSKYVGDTKLRKVVFPGGEREIDGMFILRDTVPPAALIKGISMEDGHVRTDRGMRTNIAGVFAAGDCSGRPYQYAKAVGEGNTAAHSASEYLSGKSL